MDSKSLYTNLCSPSSTYNLTDEHLCCRLRPMKTYYAQKNYAVIRDGSIVVYSRYSQAFVEDCRRIEGRKWDASEKANVFPMSSAILVRALADKWNIDLPKELREMQDTLQEDLLSDFTNINVSGGEIVINFVYDPRVINSIRNIIPDVKWDAKSRTWRVSREHADKVAVLASRFGFTVSSEIDDEIQEHINKLEAMVRASEALEGSIDVPNIAIELLPYQQAGVSYMTKARKVILADQPGLGKTAQALAAVATESRYPMVVVCPNTLKLNWQRETKKFFPGLSVSVLYGTKSEEISKSDVVIVNYDILYERTPDLFKHGFRSLVVDEAHAIKNGEKKNLCPTCDNSVRSNARRCASCNEHFDKPIEKWTVKRTDAVMKLAKSLNHNDFVFLLTGTPITNRPEELIPQLEAIGRIDDFGGIWGFKSRYAPKKNTATNTDELNRKLRSLCFVRRMKADVYGDLPPLRNAVQHLAINPKAIAEYKVVEADVVEYFATRAMAIAEEEGSDGSKAYWEKRLRLERNQGLIKITALRDAVSKLKYDNIIAWLDNFIESNDTEKVIVFAEHIELVERLYERYKDIAVKVRGGVSTDDRMASVDSFQNDPNCRMFIGNMQATSEGLTLTAASDVVFCELGWTPAIHEQCVSRCYGRTNDMHGATAWYLLAPDTIDEYVYNLLEKKKRVVDAVTNGEEGVQNTSIVGDLAVYLAEKGMGE